MAEEKKKPTIYYVNGEEQQTHEKTLTMGQIVEGAGFTPASDYELEDDADHKKYTDPSAEIHVHQKQRFTATYKGTTPTSN